jgi:hypothetical protein
MVLTSPRVTDVSRSAPDADAVAEETAQECATAVSASRIDLLQCSYFVLFYVSLLFRSSVESKNRRFG